MIYVVDTNTVRVWGNYYPASFPSFWNHLEDLVTAGRLMSVREVYNELDAQNTSDHVAEWIETHRDLFKVPTTQEMQQVSAILAIPHFQPIVGQRAIVRGSPVADPWIVAKAAAVQGCVVTEEAYKPNGVRIPNICERFDVSCMNWAGVLKTEGWRY